MGAPCGGVPTAGGHLRLSSVIVKVRNASYRGREGSMEVWKAAIVAIALGALLITPGTSGWPREEEVRSWSILADYDVIPFAQPPGWCESQPRMAPDGIMRYVYVHQSTLYFAAEGDSPPVRISGITVNCWGIDLAFRADGSAVVVWIDRRNQWASPSDGTEAGWDLFVAAENAGWSEVLVSSGTDQRVNSARVEVDPVSGDIIVVYARFTIADDPYHAALYTARSPLWEEVRISDGVDVLGYDLALDSRGKTHVAWSIWANLESVWYANETSGWSDTRVDTDQSLEWWDDRRDPSIAIDARDQAHVVWTDARRANSRESFPTELWHASTADGFANSELVLPDDTAPIPDKARSHLGFDPSGRLHIAFGGFGDGSLYYANSTDWSKAVKIANGSSEAPGSGVFTLHPFAWGTDPPTLLFLNYRMGVPALWKTLPWDFARDTTAPHVPSMADRVADLTVGLRVEAKGAWDNDRIAEYRWDFVGAEGITLFGYEAVVNFTESGEYIVTLTVRDSAGLSTSGSFHLTVRPAPRFWAFGKPLYDTVRAYGHLELHPWTDGSFPLTFLAWEDSFSRHNASGAIVAGRVRLQPEASREAAAFDPSGALHTVGYEWVSRQLEYSKANADGENEVPPKLLPLNGHFAQQPSLAYASGRMWLAWMDQRDDNMEIYLASLDLEGTLTWGPVRVSNHPLHSDEPALLVLGERLWVVWRDYRLSDWGVYGSVLDLSKMTWDVEERRLGSGVLNSVAVLPGGDVAFTAVAFTTSSEELYLHFVDSSGSPTRAPILISVPDGFPTWTSDIDADVQGGVHIVWHEAGIVETIRYARLTTSGVVEPTGGLLIHKRVGEDSPRVAIRLGSDGEPRIAYTDGSYSYPGAKLYFAYRDPVPPNATIAAPSVLLPNVTAMFSGQGSSDNMAIDSWSWDFGDGTAGEGAAVSKSFETRGTYTVSLTVTDEAGNSHTRSAEVRVADFSPPSAKITGPTRAVVGVPITISGAGSTDNAQITAYEWRVSGPWAKTALGETIEFAFPRSGSYIVELLVRDDAGNEDRAQLSILVTSSEPPSQPPTEPPTSPGTGISWISLSLIASAVVAMTGVTLVLLRRRRHSQ